MYQPVSFFFVGTAFTVVLGLIFTVVFVNLFLVMIIYKHYVFLATRLVINLVYHPLYSKAINLLISRLISLKFNDTIWRYLKIFFKVFAYVLVFLIFVCIMLYINGAYIMSPLLLDSFEPEQVKSGVNDFFDKFAACHSFLRQGSYSFHDILTINTPNFALKPDTYTIMSGVLQKQFGNLSYSIDSPATRLFYAGRTSRFLKYDDSAVLNVLRDLKLKNKNVFWPIDTNDIQPRESFGQGISAILAESNN